MSRLELLALRARFFCTAERSTFTDEMRVLVVCDGWQLVEVGWAFLWRHAKCGVLWNACDPRVVPPENCALCVTVAEVSAISTACDRCRIKELTPVGVGAMRMVGGQPCWICARCFRELTGGEAAS